MPIVENVTARSQTQAGKLTPRARQDQFRSAFGIVEGNSPPGWNGVNDHLDGIAFGESGERKIQFTEFKDAQGKTNDVVFNGLKLREMIVPIEDVKAKDKYEGQISTMRTAIAERGANQISPNVSLSSACTTQLSAMPDAPAEPELPEPKRR